MILFLDFDEALHPRWKYERGKSRNIATLLGHLAR